MTASSMLDNNISKLKEYPNQKLPDLNYPITPALSHVYVHENCEVPSLPAILPITPASTMAYNIKQSQIVFINEKIIPNFDEQITVSYSRYWPEQANTLFYNLFFLDPIKNKTSLPIGRFYQRYINNHSLQSYDHAAQHLHENDNIDFNLQQVAYARLGYMGHNKNVYFKKAANDNFIATAGANAAIINYRALLKFIEEQVRMELRSIEHATKRINSRDGTFKQAIVYIRQAEIESLIQNTTKPEVRQVITDQLVSLYACAYRKVLATEVFPHIGKMIMTPDLYYHAEDILSYHSPLNRHICLESTAFNMKTDPEDSITFIRGSYRQKLEYKKPENQYFLKTNGEHNYRHYNQSNFILKLLTDGRRGDKRQPKRDNFNRRNLVMALKSNSCALIKLVMLDEAYQYIINNRHPASKLPLYSHSSMSPKRVFTDMQCKHIHILREMYFDILEKLIIPNIENYPENKLGKLSGIIDSSPLINLPDSAFKKYGDRAQYIHDAIHRPNTISQKNNALEVSALAVSALGPWGM